MKLNSEYLWKDYKMIKQSRIYALLQEKTIEIVVLFYILLFLIVGLSMQPIDELVRGLSKIFTASGILISDYMVIGGVGPALVNASIVGLIGYVLLLYNGVVLRGISIATIFTMLGFALMGKTAWSVLPIIFGVYIYSKLTKREFVTNIYPALYGTALAPLVTHAAFYFEWGIFGGIIVGILAGLVISPIANHSLAFHEGYNLYNVGFSAGFLGLIILNIIRAFGYDTESLLIWGTEFDNFLRIFLLFIFISMVILGIFIDNSVLKDYKKILKEPGNTATDFVDIAGFGSTLLNMGLIGLIGMAYIELVGGNYNGLTISGLYTMVGFASFGKHPLNSIPIMIGVWLASLISIYEVNGPGTILAALFGTTLAPISGRYGPIVGILAGMTHLTLVSTIGVVHGGLNLYNNGFTGGFIAAFFIAIIKGIKED